MLKLRPLAGYCVIEPLDEEETTAAGLYMPEKAKEKSAKGKILGVGKQKMNEAGKYEDVEVKAGDTVAFYRWGTQNISFNQKEYLFVKFQDILGIYG